MQAYLNGLSDSLVSGLDLASEKTASYIQAKRLASWPAEAGIAYRPVEAPTIRFRLSDGGWHDPTSWALSFKLTNLTLRLGRTTIHFWHPRRCGYARITSRTVSPCPLLVRMYILVHLLNTAMKVSAGPVEACVRSRRGSKGNSEASEAAKANRNNDRLIEAPPAPANVLSQ